MSEYNTAIRADGMPVGASLLANKASFASKLAPTESAENVDISSNETYGHSGPRMSAFSPISGIETQAAAGRGQSGHSLVV